MHFIRVITLQEIEASSKQAFRKERAPLSSQVWTYGHEALYVFHTDMKHTMKIQNFVLWIQEYLLI